MKLVADLHTHTDYSHGVSTIREMIQAAAAAGLREIHITEHGYGHRFAKKLSREKYFEMKTQIEALRKEYSEMRIVFGVEANIVSLEGDIDISDEDLELFEVVNAGFHVLCKMKDARSWWKIKALAFLSSKLGLCKAASKKYCTLAALNMLDKYSVFAVTHPMSNYECDLNLLADKCAETGTLLEINNPRGKLNAWQVRQIMHKDIKFMVGSDAHSAKNVGQWDKARSIIEESGVSLLKLVNVSD